MRQDVDRSWLEVDIVDLLALNRVMSAEEIDEFLEEMSKEIWYRILNEELPKLISQVEFESLLKAFAATKNLDRLVETVSQKFPRVKIRSLLEKVTQEVKKEYMISYLEKLREDYGKKSYDSDAKKQKQREMIETITRALVEAQKNEIDRQRLAAYNRQIDRLRLNLNI